MTYRQFLNEVSDDDFVDIITTDAILHMSCNGTAKDGKLICPYKKKDCKKCIKKLLESDIDNLDEIATI